MAAGDLFVDMVTVVGTGGVDIQPAVGVSAMITFIGSALGAGNGEIEGREGLTATVWSLPTGSGSSSAIINNMAGLTNCKIFINNTMFLKFITGSGTQNYSYSGIEI